MAAARFPFDMSFSYLKARGISRGNHHCVDACRLTGVEFVDSAAAQHNRHGRAWREPVSDYGRRRNRPLALGATSADE